MNIFIGLLFIIGLSVALGVILWQLGMRDRRAYILFGISLLIHVMAVLFIYTFDFQPFSGGGGDYGSYHKAAVHIADEIGQGNFLPDIETRGGVPHYFPTIIGYVYFLTIPSMVVGQLFNAWIAGVAIMFLYFIVLELTQSFRWAFGIGLLATLYPSFLFYSSLLLKDVFVVLFALAGAFLMLRILKRFSWGLFALFYISLIGLTHFRFYVGFVFLIAFTISWFLLSREPIKARFTYGLGMIFLLGFVPQMFGMGYYGFSTLRHYINPTILTYYQDIAYTGKDVAPTPPPSASPTPVDATPAPPSVSPAPSNVAPTPPPSAPPTSVDVAPTPSSSSSSPFFDELFTESSKGTTGFASTVDLKVSFESPKAFITSFPKSFAFVAIGPFPWQFTAGRHYFALLETIPWTILSVFILLGIINTLRSRHRALSLAIFSLGLFIILTIYMSNFGITTRIRMPAFLLLLTFIPFAFQMYKHKTTAKSNLLRDYILKLKKYWFHLFSYSETSRTRIVLNIVRLIFYQLINRRFVVAKVNNYRMILDLKTPGISKSLFVYGKREFLDTYVVKEEVKGNMNILEIGANIGYYALLEATQIEKGMIYALEPDPRNLELLKRNIITNGLENKVEVFPYAGSDINETKPFYLAERTNVSSFIERDDGEGVIQVRCIKLDDFPYINSIDFIRMDIEGH